METLLICLLLLYNAYLVFYLLKEKRQQGQKPHKADTRLPEKRKLEAEGIVGKSLFKMEAKMPQATNPMPQAATFIESEDIVDMDITFADETDEPSLARLPEDKLDEAFTHVLISDVPVDYGEEETEDSVSDKAYATGASFEEIGQAVATADNLLSTKEEHLRAGRIFTEMEGNELFDQLIKTSSQRAKKITGLMDYFLNNPTSDKECVVSEVVQPQNKDEVPVDINRFDIRDFV
jgi:hypothetical protein